MRHKTKYLICYDITNPKRLQKVHRTVCRYAFMVQYSVYFAEMSKAEHDALLVELASIIHKREDDIRFYPLPTKIKAMQLGLTCFNDGIWLSGISDVFDQ
ncbi:MAG: CRISPR-associated endonuclease Cas2 [Mariprofundaceae bacterium]|nr:CRISPR-associated endonuclease Cas2 [Mariprofundaceae bacterium]